ncbi:MAG: DUF2012 domain-containing protein [candidate division NC10 bacterium]|nr:DUF2012 domain-containing protein [candidate division NC10 bacterium]
MKYLYHLVSWALGITLLSAGHGAAYEMVAVPDGATVTGKVTFKGTPPTPRRVLMTKDKEACGEGYRGLTDVSVVGGGLDGAVVLLEGISKGKPWSVPDGGYTVDQRRCAFHPHISVIPQGAEMVILNSDPVLHNIHAYEVIGRASRTLFNVAQPKFKTKVTRIIRTTTGKVVRIECDAHNWMLGWFYVADNPYAVVVGNDGTFTLSDVPPGRYTLKAWHPTLGVKEVAIKVPPKGRVEISLEFQRPAGV